MKRTLLLILGLFASAVFCRADYMVLTNAGWYSIGAYDYMTPDDPTADPDTELSDINIEPQSAGTQPSYAEVVTTDIQALAHGLQDDPLRIFNYVHDHIRYSLYFGSRKGAQLTLLEKSGNDFDQCALLVALLRAAGYSNAGYQFGWMVLPYDNPDGSHRDLRHWLGLTLSNDYWPTTSYYLKTLFREWRLYPNNAISTWSDLGNNTFAVQRLWVTLPIGGTTNYLDPSFKVSELIRGVSLLSAMGGSPSTISNALISAAGAADFGNSATAFYTTNVNEAAVRTVLATNTENLLSHIQSNYPNASLEEILGGQRIVPATNTALSRTLLFQTTNMNGTMPVIGWANVPTNMMSTFRVLFATGGLPQKSYQWYTPQLQGQRLALIYTGRTAQLWQEDNLLTSGSAVGDFDIWDLIVTHPKGDWDPTNNVYLPGGGLTARHSGYCYFNSTYVITYAFEPDWGWVRTRQRQLETYRQQHYGETSRQVVTETLNVMALNWQLQMEWIGRLMAPQLGVLPMYYHRIGRMAQENGRGYFVDVGLTMAGTASSSDGAGPQHDASATQWLDMMAYFGSAMEHGLIEQLQSSNLVGASAVKMLELANTNHQAIYLASTSNWNSVRTSLTNYNTNSLYTYFISPGYVVLLPQNGNFGTGSGDWTGHGFVARKADGSGSQMLIDPGTYGGGYVSDTSATVNPSFIYYSSYSQPVYFNSAPPSLPHLTGADPVNMADGTFQVEGTDLSLGEREPRGLNFSRYYSSSRRNSNLAGMAPGWIHNYYLNAATVSSPEAGLGGTTPAQAAAMLAATASAICFYNGSQPDPENWFVTGLIAKWGVDQLTAKAASVSLGQDTLQFIQQPDGSYTPPANCTMALTRSGNAYSLQERHGRTLSFNGSGWCTNISDQYNQSLALTYNSSNWVSQVTDSRTRSLTLTYSNYNGNPQRLTSVSDNASPSRSVALGYGTKGDLTSVRDPENQTSTFLYDTNHQVIAQLNALSQVVVSNIYNSFGRVTTQYTQGDLTKMWRIFWSGWQTVSQDPAGGKQTYFYDDKTRLVAQQDAMTNLSRTFYDGQNHVVTNVSALNEINRLVYDGNNNLILTFDPLGFSNQFVFDANNKLVRSIDPRGNPASFGYDSHFSLTGVTNGAGDWVSYSYNSDGTLHSCEESGSATTYGYDSQYGQLNSVTYTNGLGSESFVTNPQGDVTSHTDGNGNVTLFYYNNRRQLTNTIAPTNLTMRVTLDAGGNELSRTDARGFLVTSFWSPTRHLTGTVFSGTPQGAPATTNLYDSREWIFKTINNPLSTLSQTTLFTNDLAGRLIAVTDPLLRSNVFVLDADGRTIAATNAAQERVLQQYNPRGEPTVLTDNANHTVQRGFDPAGNQTALTNRNGKIWQFQSDAANRVTNTITPRGASTKVAFNDRGLVRSVTPPSNLPTTFGYDARRRMTSRSDSVGTATLQYDPNSSLTNISETINSQLSTINFSYDAYNHVSGYRDTFGNLIQYRSDGNGNVTNIIYPGNRNVFYFFDSLNRLTNVTDWAGRQTTITYDLAGRATIITRPNGTYREMGWDAAGQLTNVWEKMANGLPLAWFRFNWTNSGNMAWEFAAPQPHPITVPTRTMTYDDDNRLYTFNGNNVTSDTNGNLTFGPLTNNTFSWHGYDPRNRLLSAGGVTNVYDPANNRIQQIYGGTNTTFVVNPNAALPQVLMRIRGGVTNYYIYGLGLLYQITETATSTNTLTYHFDYRGSTVALSDGSGLVTDRIEYSLYGLTTYRAGTNNTPFLFNGKYGVMTDPNGLLYMQARYYNPYLCRFISADSAGFAGGLNWFAFAAGNPVSLLDPFGLGAREAATGSSWLDQIASGLGFDNSLNARMEREQALIGLVTLASLGTANDASTALAGYDLYGTRATTQEREAAGVITAVNFLPIGRIASGGARLGADGAELLAGRAGSFGELSRLAIVGDEMTAHHMPQAALNFTTREEGGAIAISTSEHLQTRTFGFSGAATAEQEAGLPFRTVLARDIRDLRGIAGSKYNSGIQNLLDYYRQNFPQLIAKPPRGP